MRFLIVVLALALTGCASMTANKTKEQLEAEAKDKNAHASCIAAQGVWGNTVGVHLNLDQGVIKTHGGTIRITPAANCATEITLNPPAVKTEPVK